MAMLKLELADEEAAKAGLATAPHTQSAFILMALDIEEIQ